MSIQLAVVSTTGSTGSVNLGDFIAANPAALSLKLLSDSDPASSPVDVATVHLSADVQNTAGYFLTPGAPTLDIICDPSDLWVSVHGDDEFVQILAVS